MKIKALATTLLIAMLAILPMLTVTQLPANAVFDSSDYVSFPDSYMSGPEWGKLWGNSNNVTITDVPGPGVRFDFNNITKEAVGDTYLVNIPSHGEDLSGHDGYQLCLKNAGAVGLSIHLFMNTGHTGGGWLANDTFWGGPWVSLNPGETKLYTLNFSYAEAWNAQDDPELAWRVPGGTWTNVKRLNQVTKIGFELGFDIYGAGAVVASEPTAELYVDPSPVNKIPSDNSTTFTVDIVIKNFADLYAFDINMTWDNTLLSFVNAGHADQLNTLWGTNWNVIKETSDAGSYKLAATKLGVGGNSSTSAYPLFNLTLRIIKSCNFPWQTAIHFELVKLSDSATPIPNPIYPAKVTDGMYAISATTPDLELNFVGSAQLEYCKTFEIEVNATHICANLKDYNLTFNYNTELLEFIDVDRWGELGDNVTGQANYYEPVTGTIIVWDDGGATKTGDSIFLFALTFHVKFDDRIEHIWRQAVGQPANDHMHAQISLTEAKLSFLEGTITTGGILMPSPLDLVIYFIRGDVDCNGRVSISDVSTVAYYYEGTTPVKYDLNKDGIIDLYDIVMIATNYGYGVP